MMQQPTRTVGRPKLPERKRRGYKLNCWLTPAERDQLEALAAAEGQDTLSDHIRRRVLLPTDAIKVSYR